MKGKVKQGTHTMATVNQRKLPILNCSGIRNLFVSPVQDRSFSAGQTS